MYILLEEHQYEASQVKDVLDGIDALQNVDGKVSINYVGYYYNTKLRDCVFLLPKVLLKDVENTEKVFGFYTPESIIQIDNDSLKNEKHRRFIYEFSVWLYRAIAIYQEKNPNNGIVYRRQIADLGAGKKRQSDTFLDVILSLIQFNRENQDFFMFILKNLHSGFNKINWTRTIAKTSAIIQDKEAIYVSPINKKRQINFDEELIIIFYSILNYINETYGFPITINCNFQLITDNKFKNYINGFGKTRLRQIKYKYFSDKALRLWDLCYAFFEYAHKIPVNTDQKEYLLVKNFNIVFESIIDELIGDQNIAKDLKNQADGKRVDHLYRYYGLIDNVDKERNTYYIGDSKYYKMGNSVGKESVYKQYTYARNVIQWNLDLFVDKPNDVTEVIKDNEKHYKLRDDVTEGYNVIPNFFISADLPDDLSYENARIEEQKDSKSLSTQQFKNRLFDRDTLLLSHYNVNFLYVVSLYARDNQFQKASWKSKVRDKFRDEVRTKLKEKYEFNAMTEIRKGEGMEYIRTHFQDVLGKIYTPFENKDILSLALDKADNEANEVLKEDLGRYFVVEKCELGTNPEEILEIKDALSKAQTKAIRVSNSLLTLHHIARYKDDYFILGCYKDQKHKDWIFSRNPKKRDSIYNVRLDKKRKGYVTKTEARAKSPKFLILYNLENLREYSVYRIHNSAIITEERMRLAQYENPQGDYWCYILDEEVVLDEKLDLSYFVNRTAEKGTPIFVTGDEIQSRGQLSLGI